MTEQFWHNAITDRSFTLLQELRKRFPFVLIGGWAVYWHTKALKSKDIDIIVDFETLGRIREEFDLIKNERLKKYEIKGGGFDVDIYVPHWSELGLPLEYVMKHTVAIGGFTVPQKEILLALKLFAYRERKLSLKGQKDKIDIVSLLYSGCISLAVTTQLLKQRGLTSLLDELYDILKTTVGVPELNLNQKQFADFKKKTFKHALKISKDGHNKGRSA